jgi:hypothetical protein
MPGPGFGFKLTGHKHCENSSLMFQRCFGEPDASTNLHPFTKPTMLSCTYRLVGGGFNNTWQGASPCAAVALTVLQSTVSVGKTDAANA